MRPLLLLLAAWALAGQAAACSCFSPELRAKTGRETLELASVAVFGEVLAVRADGSATLRVLESFKGPPVGTVLELAPADGRCPAHAGKLENRLLVVGFQAPPSTCETYDEEHFLLDAFRLGAGR